MFQFLYRASLALTSGVEHVLHHLPYREHPQRRLVRQSAEHSSIGLLDCAVVDASILDLERAVAAAVGERRVALAPVGIPSSEINVSMTFDRYSYTSLPVD